MHCLSIVKRLILPIAMFVGTLVYFIFAFVPCISSYSSFLEPLMNELLPISMFLMLYVTFCKVNFSRLKFVRWHFFVTAFQIISVAIVVGIILIFNLTEHGIIIFEGILSCIICSCASATAVVTQKLGGNIEEMTSYTFLSNLVSAILIPLSFPLVESSASISFISSFMMMLNRVVVILVLPMLFAYFTKHWHLLSSVYHRILSFKNLGFYLWACSLSIVTGITVRNIVHSDLSILFFVIIAFSVLAVCTVQFVVGRFIGKFFGHEIEAGQALGQKNTSFAIWVSSTYLNPLSSIGPGCYILWQNIINSIELWYYDKHH